MTQRVMSGNATKVAYNITFDNRFSGEESRVSFALVPSSDSVDSADDAEYNSVKQLSITESSTESRASEARIPEPQFPFLLLSLYRVPSPSSPRFSFPDFREETRRRLISVAPLNALSCQNERLSDLSFSRFVFRRSGIESAYLPTRTRGRGGMADVIPFFGARIVGILDFPIYCAASRFDFPIYRASRYEFSHLPRVTLCSLRQAQSAPIALFRCRHF